jgi:hypothetical protein
VNGIGLWDEWIRENNQEHWNADAAHWCSLLDGLEICIRSWIQDKGDTLESGGLMEEAVRCNKIFKLLDWYHVNARSGN